VAENHSKICRATNLACELVLSRQSPEWSDRLYRLFGFGVWG